MHAKSLQGSIVKYIVLIFFALWSVIPIALVILNSFKKQLDIFTVPPKLVFTPTLTNFKKVFVTDDFASYYMNSIYVTSIATLLSIGFGLFAAYGIVSFRLKSAKKIANVFLFAKMVPPITMLLPMFALLSRLDLQGSYVGPVIAHTSLNLAFVIWLFMSLIKDIPSDLIASAMIDGCSKMQTFWRIIVPIVTPGLAASSVLCAQLSWNELMFVLQLTNMDTYTLPVGIAKFVGAVSVDWGKSSAAATVTMVPMIIIGFFVQKYIAEGTTGGAVKG